MTYIIRLQRNVLEYLTLAAIEAYCEGRGRKRSKLNYVETLGYIWGVQKQRTENLFCSVEKAVVSISAERSPKAVMPNANAAELMSAIVGRWSPQLTMIGDFHSHPYNNLKDLASNKGWQYSEADKKHFLEGDLLWRHTPHPVMLVVAVCPMERVRFSVVGQFKPNVIKYAVGRYQLWISGAVGYSDSDGVRRVTANSSYSSVQLVADVWEENHAGARLTSD